MPDSNETEVDVRVVWFVPPNARQVVKYMHIPASHKDAYDEMGGKYCIFTAENLGTGLISLCVDNGNEDLDIELVRSKEDIVEGLCKLLDRRSWK